LWSTAGNRIRPGEPWRTCSTPTRSAPWSLSTDRPSCNAGAAWDNLVFQMSERNRLLDGYPLVTTITLLWGDQDAFGHINNLAYIRWAETGRVEYLERVGMWAKLPPTGVAPILASIKCDYKAQMTYPDTVLVGTRVTHIGNSSVRMEHRLVSRNQDCVVADLDSTLVLLDYPRGKTVPVSPRIRALVADLEGRAFDPAPELAEARA
jgi:acyl-CoA thioester hydrolase